MNAVLQFVVRAIRDEVEKTLKGKTPEEVKATLLRMVEKMPPQQLHDYCTKAVSWVDRAILGKEA